MKIFVFTIFLFIILINVSLGGEVSGTCETGYDVVNKIFYTVLYIDYNINLLVFQNTIYGGINVLYDMNGLSGQPFKNIYILGGKIKYKKIYFGIEHFCVHPVISNRTIFWYEPYWNMTKVYAGIRW